jgi:hypothetical protein
LSREGTSTENKTTTIPNIIQLNPKAQSVRAKFTFRKNIGGNVVPA